MERKPEESLELDARNRIHSEIARSSGIHFRELQRRTGLAVGTLQYHLGVLEKKRLIFSERKGKFLRYYSIRSRETDSEKDLLSLLRQETTRKILLFLLSHGRATNSEIASASGLFPSTVSWHLSHLLSRQVVVRRKHEGEITYHVQNPDEVARVIEAHRQSFLDELVDNFIDLWKQL